jgi:hypothetical protein
MHITRSRQSINQLHSLLFIKDNGGKHLSSSTLPFTWAIFATLIYYGISKWKVGMKLYSSQLNGKVYVTCFLQYNFCIVLHGNLEPCKSKCCGFNKGGSLIPFIILVLSFHSFTRATTIVQHCCFIENTIFANNCLITQTCSLVVKF